MCAQFLQDIHSICIVQIEVQEHQIIVELDTSEHGYWCGASQAAGDVDGDGLPEVVTLSNDSVIVYDPRTGEPTLRSTPLDFP